MNQISHTPPSAATADHRPAEPSIHSVASILVARIAAFGRGGLARDVAAELELAAEQPGPLAAEYRHAAALLRREVEQREQFYAEVDEAVRQLPGRPA